MNKKQIFSIFIVLAIITTLLLGFWQIKRSEQKNTLNHAIKYTFEHPLAYNEENSQPYQTYIISGFYDFQKQILLGPRTFNNQIGMYVYTIFVTDNNEHLLVNRGFVSKNNSMNIKSAGKSDDITIKIFSLGKPKQSWYSAKNSPHKNQWVSLDFAEIESFFKLDLGQHYFKEIVNPEHKIDSKIIASFTANYQIDNIHTKYIYFWFLFSLTFLIMLVIYVKSKKT